MQNLHRFLIGLLVCIFTLDVYAVSSQLPEIPTTVRFASLNVKFDGKARAIIQTEISRLMVNQKFWDEKLERAQLYFPIIETVLIDEEVPIDFKYLVAQESSFRPDAVSTSNAVGFWQMKKETAQGLGFRVDEIIDERKNITSSTQAAARYLKQNNQQLNNWISSLYSYYLGLGGVSKVLPANWKNAREITLDSKTDIYLLRFFAHKIAMESALESFRSTNPYMLIDSPVGNGKSFNDISRALNIAIDDLKRYNTWTSTDNFPVDKNYFVTLPIRKAYLSEVREKLYLVTSAGPVTTSSSNRNLALSNPKGIYPILERKPKPTSDGHALYTVNGLSGIQALDGDNAKSLAKAGQIRAPKLLQYNDMGVNDPIITNEVYYLTEKKRQGPIKFHTVREGETLQEISQMYGIRLRDLLKYNRINNRNYAIETGRVLWMTEKRPKRTKIEFKTPEPIDTHPLNDTAPAKEPIAVNTPVEEPKTTPQENTIPSNASERKKYTPKMADKTVAEPAPVVTEVAKPAETTPADNLYRPSEKKTAEVTAPALPKGNDRIIVISGNNSESEPVENSGFDNEEPVAKPQVSSTPKTETKPAAPVENTKPTEYRYHTVTSGQTLFSISRQYKVPVTDLLRLNRFPSNVKINTGQRIIIGSASDSVASTQEDDNNDGWSKPANPRQVTQEEVKAEPKITSSETSSHTVVRGETYYSIARKYGLTLKELLNLNNLTVNNQLAAGQTLKVTSNGNEISTTNQPVQSARTNTVHKVQKGETLFAISRQYNVSVEEIKKLNNKKANTVIVGETLKIPSR